MITLVTWNVQWFRGLDGRVDPARVVAHAKSLADFDLLCVQELADNFPDPSLAGNDDRDQFALLAALLPGFEVFHGVGSDHPATQGRRRRFGNAIASRLPVQAVRRHALPWPADPRVASMQRVAVDAVVMARDFPVRVITTHLEYWSAGQRAAQVEALRGIHAEAHGQARLGGAARDDGGPFQRHAMPKATLVCGDFNMGPDDPSYLRMLAPFDDGTSRFRDAWRVARGNAPQPPTFNVFERYTPASEPVACDFVFASDEIASAIRSVDVDSDTRLSDHQPVVVTLDA
ncbi:MAG: endonuclease/exonuclease/phosphatase family protein [Burkholderiales bacterium]|nr:endonuclease/exonuclease/phosphatase family protein [Burkholderiales bacterium]